MKDIYKIPNLLSILRIVLIIPISYLMIKDLNANRFVIISLILFTGFTDVLDGMIARKFNQISELGKIIDPIADKLSVFIFALLASYLGLFPVWLFIIILSRDLIILVFGLYLKKKKGMVLMSNYPGKYAAFGMWISILFSLSGIELLTIINSYLYYIILALIIYSSYIYLKRYLKTIGE